MPTKAYYKLVRDHIPEIIEADGKKCACERLSDEDYLSFLDQKLNEELAEYQESKSLEELADLLEVMQAVVKARGWTLEELSGYGQTKRPGAADIAARGRFRHARGDAMREHGGLPFKKGTRHLPRPLRIVLVSSASRPSRNRP